MPKNLWVALLLVAFTNLSLALGPGAHRATAVAAGVSAGPQLVLTAEGHSGPRPFKANLNEIVSFTASYLGKMQKGEYLAIVTLKGNKLVSAPPCAKSTCAGEDHYPGPGIVTHQYVAKVYGRGRVIVSAPVTVEWEKLTLDLQFASVVQGTIHYQGGDPQTLEQLNGLPFHVSVSAPKGWATSWKMIEIRELQPDGTRIIILKLTPGGSPTVETAVQGSPRQYEAVAKNGVGDSALFSHLTVVKTRPWNVLLNAQGPSRSATDSLTTDVGSQVILTAVIQEPEAAALAKVVSLDVESNPSDPKNYFVEKHCEHESICSATVKKTSAQSVPYQAFVEIPDAQQTFQRIGSSSALQVNWASATLEVPPGKTTADMRVPNPEFTNDGSIDVTGAISDTFTANDGTHITTCVDALYSEVDFAGGFDCNGTWPEPDGKNIYRTEVTGVTSAAIALVPASCTRWPCELKNALDYPGSGFNPEHKYHIRVVNPNLTISGKAAFWASPLGLTGQGHAYGGQFSLTLHYGP